MSSSLNHHYDLDDSDDSVIHQDSDDEQVQHDDDVDIGFRRHQYETFDDTRPKRARKEDAIYGVFYENDQQQQHRSKRFKTDAAPMFVSAKKKETVPSPPPPPPPSSSSSSTDPPVSNQQESQEDIEMRKQEKAADDYFLSLLNKGRGKRRPKTETTSTTTTTTAANASFEQASSSSELGGLGLGATPLSFGTQQSKQQKPKVKSDLGKWEKHTKGIGSKLLSKMGWSGTGGLGSNRRKLKKDKEQTTATEKSTNDQAMQSSSSSPPPPPTSTTTTTTNDNNNSDVKARKGISRPVEVVVRPANLGLGFGNFKEASQLKTNRQIEAEVRGLELPTNNEKEEKDDNNDLWKQATSSSAIPDANDIMAQKQWKRTRTKKEKGVKVKVVPYQELLKEQESTNSQPLIIDMRGPQHQNEQEQQDKDGQVPLGTELLHNISFLLNTHENKLHSTSHFLRSSEHKVKSFQSDIKEMEERKKMGNERMAKLQKTLALADRIEGMVAAKRGERYTSNGHSSSNLLFHVQTLVQQLGEEFTEEERQSLNFWELLAPAMIGPVLDIQLDHWDPFLASNKPMSTTIIDSVFQLGIKSLRNSVITSQLLPKVRKALESSRWKASHDMDVALDLYEQLYENALKDASIHITSTPKEDNGSIFPGQEEDEEEQQEQYKLSRMIKKVLMIDTIYPKLQNEVSQWKPSLEYDAKGRQQIRHRLDLWILPWLPHLDHATILPNLLLDCRRKVKNCIEYLHRKVSNDTEYLQTSIDTLKPWRNVLDAKTIQRLVSDTVVPRLGRFLARQNIQQDAVNQDWHGLEIVFEMHKLGLISDMEFLSVIEGELLIKWASVIYELLQTSRSDIGVAVLAYKSWKIHLGLTSTLLPGFNIPDVSKKLLQQDDFICRIFYCVLKMIHLTSNSKHDELDEFVSSENSNFRLSLARRMKEQERASEENFIRFQSQSMEETEARIRLQRQNIHTPTFREVVEEFAKDRGILFQPKMGSNSHKDGRQVFQFGEASIYIEGDVVFALKSQEWLPVALNQLTNL